MAVTRDNSQQTTANVSVVGSDGESKTVVSATCVIRPGKGMTFTVDVLESIEEANLPDVCTTVAAYMAEEIAKAATLGVPIALPASE